MPCYHPVRAYRLGDGSVIFAERGNVVANLDLPCGKCVGCRLERSRQWAVRCMHEASMHDSNLFVTLTYNDANLPRDLSLNYRHFQSFLKRLRARLQYQKIRFYMCGEYGDTNLRPHYHACLFNLTLPDLEAHKVSDTGAMLFRSKVLDECWKLGFCWVGEVTFKSAAYCARYVMKKVDGRLAKETNHYMRYDMDTGEIWNVVPEFNRMSLRKAIGLEWLEKYSGDVYPHDRVVINGAKSKPPRYYDKWLEKINSAQLEEIKYKRVLDNSKRSSDNTDARLAVRERVQQARLSRLKRIEL